MTKCAALPLPRLERLMPLSSDRQSTPKLPTIDDLCVYRRDEEMLVVTSWLTRGRCAEVFKFSFSDHYSIQPFLTHSYMQGISYSLILEAVKKFVADEAARNAARAVLATA